MFSLIYCSCLFCAGRKHAAEKKALEKAAAAAVETPLPNEEPVNAEPLQPENPQDQPKTAFEKKQEAFDVDYDLLYANSNKDNSFYLVHGSFLKTLCNTVRCPLDACGHIGTQRNNRK